MRKQIKYVAKRKTQFNNLHVSVQAFVAGFAALLLSRSAFVSHPGSPAPLLTFFESPIYLLSYFMPAPIPESLAILLPLLILGLAPLHLISPALRRFK